MTIIFWFFIPNAKHLVSFNTKSWFLILEYNVKFQNLIKEVLSFFSVSVSEVEALYELYLKVSNSVIEDGLIHKVN